MQPPGEEASQPIVVDYGPRILNKLQEVIRLMSPPVGPMPIEERLAKINALMDEILDDCLDLSEPTRTTILKEYVSVREQIRAIKV